MRKKPFKRGLFAILFAMLTVEAMVLFFSIYEPWVPIGPDRIINGDFEHLDSLKEWTGWDSGLTQRDPSGGFGGSAGVVLSTTSTRNGVLRKTITETDNIPAFRISLRATTRHIKPGLQVGHQPRAIFFYTDLSKKPLFNLPHGVFNITKDLNWRQYINFFPVPGNIKDARLQIQNFGTEGTLAIDDISVIPVTPRPSAPVFSIFFIVLWVSALAACLVVLEPWKTLPGIAVIFYALAIIIGVMLPGEILDGAIRYGATAAQRIKQRIERPAPAIAKKPSPTQPIELASAPRPVQQSSAPKSHQGTLIDQVHQHGHFILFMILALCAMKAWAPAGKPGLHALPVTAGLCLFAAATEALQFTTLDRKPDLVDLGVDLFGILIAVVAATLLTQTSRVLKKYRPKTDEAPLS